MTADHKKELILNNLDCANCAAKIEKAVQQLDEIRLASVDFVSNRLTYETTDPFNTERVLEKVKQTITQVEPGIKVVESKQQETMIEADEKVSKAMIARLTAGSIIFLIVFILNLTPWLELVMYIASYILIGGKVLIRAAKNIVHGQVFDEHFLMGVATIGAFAIRAYPEAVAVMLFYEIGDFFEGMAVGHSKRSISALLDIRPDYANLKRGSEIIKVSPDQVAIGDFIVIKPGEKIPLDGKISEGSTLLDTSAITGESLPREVSVGDEVYSGSINKNGLFTIEVTRLLGESTVSKILDLVQNASSKKAPTEKFITKFAHYYTPTVVLIAFVLAIVPPLLIPEAGFSDWIYRALAFLVVSCPCALVISIPLGYFGGIGAASKNGILVKGSNYLEALTKVKTVVFDKTGTLTQGVFSVTKVHSVLDSVSNNDLLKTAAYAEYYSNHPIAKSIVIAFGAHNIDPEEIREFDETPGKGIQVRACGLTVLAGNAKFLESENIQVITPDEIGTLVHIAIDQQYAGYLVIADEVKQDSLHAIRRLKSVGIDKIAMLTGDIESVGLGIARDLGIDEVYSELLPGQKVEHLEAISDHSRQRGKIAFVGDGINDAPVLARADVGISMGALGSDAAIEAADIVIMTDHPSKVADAILIARKTNRIVWQNIIFAFTVKVAVLIMSAGGVATLWEAVFADMGVALIAIFNSIRVLNYKDNIDRK